MQGDEQKRFAASNRRDLVGHVEGTARPLRCIGQGFMPPAMTNQVTASLPDAIQVPRGLAVPPIQEGHRRSIKVDEMQLLTAMGVVTGIAGGAPVVVQMSAMIGEIGGAVETGDVGIIVVAVEADLLAVNAASAAGHGRVLGLPAEDVQAG